MDLRLTFNEDEYNYDQYRPTYPEELFNYIIKFSGIHKTDKILEIGIGTGQATLPFLQAGCDITAIELGDKLAEYSRNKFALNDNIRIINADFADCEIGENTYDLIYSATAFHWIAPETGYGKAKKILKSGGAIALFWNHPYPNRLDDEVNQANRRIYDKYRPSDKPVAEFIAADCSKRLDELRQYGFVDITSKLYHRVRKLKSEDYIALLNTYSDHRALALDIKSVFEREMKRAIDDLGGEINIYDTIDLYLARKP